VRRAAGITIFGLLLLSTLRAQTPPPVRFDVVSIRVDREGTGGAGDELPRNGNWKWTRIPLSFLVSDAYGVPLEQVTGIPGMFMGRDLAFDIQAKMSPAVTADQFREMLQAMLADRFHFSMHRETRDIPVTVVEVAKGGLKLARASGICGEKGQPACGSVTTVPKFENGILHWHYAGASVTMDDLAKALAKNEQVINETGIAGVWDLDVTIDVKPAAPTNADEQSDATFAFQTALHSGFEKQAGLNIDMRQKKKRPMLLLVVDHVELPTAN
jgi:uncharacterized protein (TIGR03435 family)